MTWTYLFEAPSGVPTPDVPDSPGNTDNTPGHVIMAERRQEAGIVDLFLLEGRNDTFRTATYGWAATGTPEAVMEALAEQIKNVPGGQS